MATCLSCRKQFPEEAKHCPHCGAARKQVEAEQGKRTVFGYAPSPEDLQLLAQGAAASSAPAPGPAALSPDPAPAPSPSPFPSPPAAAPSAAPAPGGRSRPSGQLDVMAKTMFPSNTTDAAPGTARIRATGAAPVMAPPVQSDPELALGETIAAPATPFSGPGMLSPADAVASTAVTVTDDDDALGAAPVSGEVKWGGVFRVFSPGSHAPVSGRTLGLFVGDVPADQEHALQAAVLSEVNAALGASPVPLGEIDLQGELLTAVNAQLSAMLPSLGATGRVTEIKLSIDSKASEAAQAKVDQRPGSQGGVDAPGDTASDDVDFEEIAGGAKLKVILIAVGVTVFALIICAVFIF